MHWLRILFSKKSFEEPKKREYTVLTRLDVKNIENIFNADTAGTLLLQDIASKFNISKSTVSRVKNYTHRYSTKTIGDETEEHV